MGRKTKKEKIIADLKRQLSKTKVQTVIASQISYSPPIQSESIYAYPAQLIKKDLTKTIVLAILAIGFEVIAFLITEGRVRLPTAKLVLPISLGFS